MGNLSGVRPLMYKLTVKHLVETPSDSRLTKQMKRVLLTDLQSRYTDLSVGKILHKACFLILDLKLFVRKKSNRVFC